MQKGWWEVFSSGHVDGDVASGKKSKCEEIEIFECSNITFTVSNFEIRSLILIAVEKVSFVVQNCIARGIKLGED